MLILSSRRRTGRGDESMRDIDGDDHCWAGQDLREKTGAGMMDCKNALSETGGDIEAAIDWLRKKGLAKAAKKSGRVAADGLVGVAVEDNVGVVVEVNSETDFVARNDDFQALVRGVLAVALARAAHVDADTVLGAHYRATNTPVSCPRSARAASFCTTVSSPLNFNSKAYSLAPFVFNLQSHVVLVEQSPSAAGAQPRGSE